MPTDKNTESDVTGTQVAPRNAPRVSFERLRERTDELELIISGISLLALISLPSWLLERWTSLAVHLESERLAIVTLAFPLAIGLSYTLAAAFLLHLSVRAYWVGLIGLKAIFPGGVRWEKLRKTSTILREYQASRVDLDASIESSDRVASTIFVLISLIALSIIWIGAILIGMLLLTMLAIQLFELPESSARIFDLVLAGFFIGIPLLVFLVDRTTVFVTRPERPPPSWLAAPLRMLLRVQSLLGPQRLMFPVQLTLESNLPARTFSLAFGIVLSSTVMIGLIQPRLTREFSLLGAYSLMQDADIDSGMRSAHYESLRSAADRLLFVPMIPADLVSDSRLRLFLPYLPSRDNSPLRSRCADTSTLALRHACLASIWSVALDGKPIAVADFVGVERRDLGLRGLQGYLSMEGLAPGAHELEIHWNAVADPDAAEKARSYRIPFWFAPPYQLDLGLPDPHPQGQSTPVQSDGKTSR